jgi:hypothetical protein
MSIEEFAVDLRQQIIQQAEMDDELKLHEDAFTFVMFDYLSEASEVEDSIVCSHRAYGMQVSGYCVSDDEEQLDVAVSLYKAAVPTVSVSNTEINATYKKMIMFITRSLSGYYKDLEESNPAYDMALRIYEIAGTVDRIRLFLFTDGRTKMNHIEDTSINGIAASHHIWDIERLYRFWNSGKKRETLDIDTAELLGSPLTCITMPNENDDYTSYLAIMPGLGLAKLYEAHGARLLERNVRSFLQVRGSVNKGIRATITKEPHMFLAYNNGLSATAESVDFVQLGTNTIAINRIRDLQIVNGGQSTASIYHAYKKDKSDLSQVYVQVKLTVLKSAARMDEVVPRISEYANSQNKIQTADFSANDPFHRQLEELSRTVWAPAANGGQRQTKWFYERSRGQYADAKQREGTSAKIKAFEASHPTKQFFTKTDLAKYENTWYQLPHAVSKGAQRNFHEFTVRLRERGTLTPDKIYFENLIAKAIMFKRAEKIIQEKKYGGYRANLVTYTLAWISRATGQRVNLKQIWKEQSLTQAFEGAISKVSEQVYAHITNPVGWTNVTEYCKREVCWNNLLEKQIELPPEFLGELVDIAVGIGFKTSPVMVSDQDRVNIDEVEKVSAEVWFAISAWAKETHNLQNWQRSLSVSLGKLASTSRKPSPKQAAQGKLILDEAARLGFNIGVG